MWLRPSMPHTSKKRSLRRYGGVLTLGWFMLPWFVVAMQSIVHDLQQRRVRLLSPASLIGLGLLFVGAIPWIATGGNACLTNSTGTFVQNAHFGPIFLSDMDEPGRWSQLGGVEWPLAFWKVLSLLAILTCAVVGYRSVADLSSRVSRRLGSDAIANDCNEDSLGRASGYVRAHAIGLLAVVSAGALLLVFLIEPHLDRYWLFVLAAFLMAWMCVLQAWTRKWSGAAVAWAAACVVLHLAMATVFAHDMLAWNDARWRYVEFATEARHAG